MLPCKDSDVLTGLSSTLLENPLCTHVQLDEEEKANSPISSNCVQMNGRVEYEELGSFVAYRILRAALALSAIASSSTHENDLYGSEPASVSKTVYIQQRKTHAAVAANISTGRAVVKMARTDANTPEKAATAAILYGRLSIIYSATIAVDGMIAESTTFSARANRWRTSSLTRPMPVSSGPAIGSYDGTVSAVEVCVDIRLTSIFFRRYVGR